MHSAYWCIEKQTYSTAGVGRVLLLRNNKSYILYTTMHTINKRQSKTPIFFSVSRRGEYSLWLVAKENTKPNNGTINTTRNNYEYDITDTN